MKANVESAGLPMCNWNCYYDCDKSHLNQWSRSAQFASALSTVGQVFLKFIPIKKAFVYTELTFDWHISHRVKPQFLLSAEHDATTFITSALFVVSDYWNTCPDSTLSQHTTIVNAPIATYFPDFEIHDRCGEHGHKHGCRFRFYRYLEGATPTRFGPRPRNRDLGPSFSRIDLENSNHINE